MELFSIWHFQACWFLCSPLHILVPSSNTKIIADPVVTLGWKMELFSTGHFWDCQCLCPLSCAVAPSCKTNVMAKSCSDVNVRGWISLVKDMSGSVIFHVSCYVLWFLPPTPTSCLPWQRHSLCLTFQGIGIGIGNAKMGAKLEQRGTLSSLEVLYYHFYGKDPWSEIFLP